MGWLTGALTVLSTLFAAASMQFKKMEYVLICQLVCNSLLALQYVVEGRVSVTGVIVIAVVQIIVSYFFDKKEKAFPVWLIGVFILLFTVVSVLMMESYYDLITCAAVWCCALCLAQKRSSVARIYLMINTVLWLTYDIIMWAPTAAITHGTILVFIIVGIVRLDREEWKAFFAKLCKRNPEKAEIVVKNEK